MPPGFTIVRGRSAAAAHVPIDVWLDAEGRVRRVWFVASYDQSDTLTHQTSPGHTQSTVSTTHTDIEKDLSLTHLGEPVRIEVPSPAEVTPLDTGSGGSANAVTN